MGERNAYIGEATNNVAEYRALLLGLELARELGADEVEVINDSELVARQIGGEYKVKHAGLKPLFIETMRELREFDSWAVRSVRREQNERADELVNEALDEALRPETLYAMRRLALASLISTLALAGSAQAAPTLQEFPPSRRPTRASRTSSRGPTGTCGSPSATPT